MKNAIRAILALMVLLAFAATACGSAPSGNDAALAPAAISLTWTEDSLDTLTVTWQTTAAAAGQVRFGPRAAGAGAVRTVAAQMQPVHTNQGVRYVHSAVLRGLQPDTDYRYQVAAGAVWSRSYRFTAAGQQAFAFLVFGDSQSVNYAVWRDTLQQARLANPGAAFMTVVGDLVDVGGDYGQWQDWFGAGEGVLESLPVMPLPGNHESYTPERVFSRPQLFTSLFSLPQNGPAGMQEQAYSFDYGDVHFVMLDTQAGEQREFLPDLLQRQTAWPAAVQSGRSCLCTVRLMIIKASGIISLSGKRSRLYLINMASIWYSADTITFMHARIRCLTARRLRAGLSILPPAEAAVRSMPILPPTHSMRSFTTRRTSRIT